MKKLLVTGALALAVALVTQQQASAWCHWKFGVGLNLEHQGGGNNWLWGFMRNGQPPGYPDPVNSGPNCPGVFYKNYHMYGPPGPGAHYCPNGHCGGGPGPGFGPGPMMVPFGHGPGPAGPMPPASYGPPAGASGQASWDNTYSNVNFQPDYYQAGSYFIPVSNYDR